VLRGDVARAGQGEAREGENEGMVFDLMMRLSPHVYEEIGNLQLLPAAGDSAKLKEDMRKCIRNILETHREYVRACQGSAAAMLQSVVIDAMTKKLTQDRAGKPGTRNSHLDEHRPSPDARLGLKWEEIGLEPPRTGKEIKENEALTKALQRAKFVFSKDEVQSFEIADLSYSSYIKASDRYYRPKEEPWCSIDILNDCYEVELSKKGKIEVQLKQPIAVEVDSVRLWIRKLEIFQATDCCRQSLQKSKEAKGWGKVTASGLGTGGKQEVQVSEADWSFFQRVLDIKSMRNDHKKRVALLINRPYASDLDPWICDGGITDSHTLLVLSSSWIHGVLLIAFTPSLHSHFASAGIAGYLDDLLALLNDADTDKAHDAAAGDEGSTARGLESSLRDTLGKNWKKRDHKNLEQFLEHRHQAQCTLSCCARTNPWPVRGTLRPWPKDKASHPNDDLQLPDYSECVYCKGLGGKDGGLFTGETLLHIAIVQHNLESIQWLLHGGAHLDDRALGIFFQFPNVPRLRHATSMTSIGHFLATLHEQQMMMLLSGSQDALEPNNFFSECNYGEFPLSFASAVGDEHVCHLLIEQYNARIMTIMRNIASTSSTFLSSEALVEKSRSKVPLSS